MSKVRILEAREAGEISAVRDLFVEYASTLPFDLGYQDFDGEIASAEIVSVAPVPLWILACEPGLCDLDNPDHNVAFDDAVLEAWLREAGLTVEHRVLGHWAGPRPGSSVRNFQDIYVLRPAGA